MCNMDPWVWQDDAYKLDSESPLVISQSFWQDLSQAEANSSCLFASTPAPERELAETNSRSVFSSTPASERLEPFSFGISLSNTDPEGVAYALRSNARFKRRRMLLFSGDHTVLGCEAQCESGNDALEMSDEYEASTRYLTPGVEESSCSEEAAGSQSDKWVENCLGNRESRDDFCDQTRNFLDDVEESYDVNEGLYSNSTHGCDGQHADVYEHVAFCMGMAASHPEEVCAPNLISLEDSLAQAQASYEQSQRSSEQATPESQHVLSLAPTDASPRSCEKAEGSYEQGADSSGMSPQTEIGQRGPECQEMVGPWTIRPTTSVMKSLVPRGPKLVTSVAYPFALLKPSGVQGDVTLHDINKRISGSLPRSQGSRRKEQGNESPDGDGLSGRAVVALTKVHTEGKGTITIIRTKG